MSPPLELMRIRAADVDHTLSMAASPVGGAFGSVRSHGRRIHQGWDILAPVGTPVKAIASGRIEGVRDHGDYGLQILLHLAGLQYHFHDLYAFYAHLSNVVVIEGWHVCEGEVMGFTGISGNAHGTGPHLHFEIRTAPWPGRGTHGRIDPGEILGYQYYACFA
jgi:murein DD-endopeptidase MepM/ murein hydrolase activator NlpD